jgi:glycosyltransferase involved in cell wall biosynthesis
MGFEVCAITREDKPVRIAIRNVNGVTEACYGADPKNKTRFLFSLLKNPSTLHNQFFKKGPYDAAICHQPFTGIALLIKGKLREVPIFYVFHSPSHEEYLVSNEGKGWLANFPQVLGRRIIEGFCLRRAKRIMVLSNYMKNKLVSIHRLLPSRIIVNPGGVDLDRFKPPKNRLQLKKELGLPIGKIHLLTVRNLEPRMGLENLLKCMYLLKTNGVPVHLTLAGAGVERKKLERLANDFTLADTVTMTGFIQQELLPKYYGASDFFILPTRRLEGFGLVTPESMACGTPVLGTPVGGTREILSDFAQSFLFRDTTAEAMAEGIHTVIDEYFSQKRKYGELRRRCRIYVKDRYSWKRHLNKLKNEIIDYNKSAII